MRSDTPPTTNATPSAAKHRKRRTCRGCLSLRMDIAALRIRCEHLEGALADARRRLENLGDGPERREAPRVLQ